MKKLLLLSVILLTITFFANAQTFEFTDENGVAVTGTTLVLPVEVSGSSAYNLRVRNLTGEIVNAKINKTYVEGPLDGSFDSMCSPVTSLSGGSCVTSPNTPTFTLAANELSGLAEMHYEPGANSGVTGIRYKVYNTANEDDFVTVILSFSTLTNTPAYIAKSFNVFPNPADKNFVIEHNYGSKAYVEVYNVLGKQVAKINTGNNSTVNIDCSKWESGYYFCRLFNDGKIEKTVKLVVTH